jgi:hypothetical protein
MLNVGVILPRGLLYVVLLQTFTPGVTDPFVFAVPIKQYMFASWLYYVTVWASGISSGLLSSADYLFFCDLFAVVTVVPLCAAWW